MDIVRIGLHYLRMDTPSVTAPVPDYRLYRETRREAADFWIHSEPIPDRTELHRWEIAAHRHSGLFQIFHVTGGSGEIVDGRAATAFEAPCTLFIPAASVHGFRFARDVDGDVVTAAADRLAAVAASDRWVGQFAQAIRVIPLGDDDVMATLARLVRETAAGGLGRNIVLEALVAIAVTDLARAWFDLDGPGEAAGGGDRRVAMLRDLVDLHFRAARPLAFFAGEIGVSASQLNRIVRRETGQTVQTLLAQRLMEAARRDLVFTPTPINAIAEALGFADPAYFNRFFRKRTGMTPGAYRAREQAQLALEPRAGILVQSAGDGLGQGREL